MTRWANEHVDECCLRFLNVFETDEDYEFNLGYVCSDEEYNRHYIDFVTGGKNMTEEEVNERASQIVMKMPQKPGEALKYLVEEAGKARRKKISAQELSERCGVSKRTVYYWLEEEYQLSAEVFVRIVVGLHLPPYISMRFMNVCGVMLQFYGVHMIHIVGTGSALRSAVICFYLSNEGLSLLENAAHIGLPIPDKMKDVLAQLHGRTDEIDKATEEKDGEQE